MEKATSTLPPVWAWLFGIVSLGDLISYICYGQETHQLVAAVGFGFIACAVYQKAPANLKDATPENKYLYWIAMVGAVLVVSSYIIKYAIKA